MKQIAALLVMCLSFTANAQSNRQHRLDSLRIAITHAKEDTDKVKLLLVVGRAFINVNADEAIRYAQQAADLAEKRHDKRDLATAYNQLGIAYNDEDKYNKALKNYEAELALSRELNDKNGEGRALCNIGLLYTRLNNLNKAMDNLNEAKVILKEVGNKKFLGNTLAGIGKVHVKKMEYAQAIACYKKSLELYDSTNDKKGKATSYNELSWLYCQKGQYKLAEDNALQALAAARDEKYEWGIKMANEMLDKIHAAGK